MVAVWVFCVPTTTTASGVPLLKSPPGSFSLQRHAGRPPPSTNDMPLAPRKRGPPSGLRIQVDPNASTSTLAQTSSQPSLLLDASPATLSAAPSADTPLSPAVVDTVAIHTDDAPAPSAQPALAFPRAKRAGSLRNMKQLSLQLPSSAAAQQPVFSMAPHDQSDPASSSDVTVHELPSQAPHARRPLTLSLPATPSRAAFQPPVRQSFRTRSSSIVSTTSVASLQVLPHTTHVPMTASTSSFATRAKEDDNGAPYTDGPIEILPGIWLGQEENARNWSQLEARGIRWVLNVAKEVAPPYLDGQNDMAPRPVADPRNPPKSAVDERLRIRPSASTPNLAQPQTAFLSRRKPGPEEAPGQPVQPQAVPFVPPTGGSALLYIHLPWSHGQSDLVKSGFPTAMSFVDHARRKGQGVLIHCQCGVSRSATLVIALVMRASMPRDDVPVPEELKSVQGSMHNAYAFVKEKSKWVGPNMSLIYQLLEYERTLSPKKDAASVTSEGTEASDEEEWSRKRLAMEREEEAEAAAAAEEDRTREARDLDRAMEERMAAKKAGPPAPLLLNPPPAPGAGTWRSRFPARKRAGSVHSTFTSSSSVISEDPLEDDEDSEEGEANITVMPPTEIMLVANDESSARTTTDEEASPSAKFLERFADSTPKLLPPPPGKAGMKHRRSASLAIAPSSLPPQPPPSAPAHRMSFGGIPPPPQTATRSTFGPIPQPPLLRRPSPRGAIPPSAPAGKSGFTFPTPGSRASSIKSYSSTKRTPLPTVPSSPVAVPTLATPKTARSRPAPLRLPVTPPAPHVAIVPSSSAPQQTLFVFPPDRTHTACTPSTLTLTMMTPRVDSFAVTPTPRKASFGATKRGGMKRMSWLGMGAAPATPTTACSRVDAKGWVGLDAGTTRPPV
ncbi:Dual specificity phosphatase, catalytic domain [Ceratobasidium sp. AG-Ba]|nr:Dual specificity phosphatase, catalytic domain [Ceratobasidium sp. AG-Ba]